MTDTTATRPRLTRQGLIEVPIAPPKRKPRRSTRTAPRGNYLAPSIKRAIELMVWDGLDLFHAAVEAGITRNRLTIGLQMPKAKRYYREQLELAREHHKAGALHRIADLSRNAISEAVKLQANKHLEADERSGDQAPSNTSLTVNVGIATVGPGYVIDVSGARRDVSEIAKRAGSVRSVLDLQAEQLEERALSVDHRPEGME